MVVSKNDFTVIKLKSIDDLRGLFGKKPTEQSWPYPFPYTYIFVSCIDKYVIKVGRSRQPYYRLQELNQQARKFLGYEFKVCLLIDSPIYFENELKKELRSCKFEVNSKINGSTEFYDLRLCLWKKPETIVNKVILGICTQQE